VDRDSGGIVLDLISTPGLSFPVRNIETTTDTFSNLDTMTTTTGMDPGAQRQPVKLYILH